MDDFPRAVWAEHAKSETECNKLSTWQAAERCSAGVLKPTTEKARNAQRAFCDAANKGLTEEESRSRFVLRADVMVNGQVYRFECEEKQNVTHK